MVRTIEYFNIRYSDIKSNKHYDVLNLSVHSTQLLMALTTGLY